MMSARQFSEKYPGKEVKLSGNIIDEYGSGVEGLVKQGAPIGIVVGFRPGTKGIIGSSKVAIHHDKYNLISQLNPKTGTSYTPVIDNAPDRRTGIYFLSVSNIELLEQPKSVVVYPSHCKNCGSPARRGKWFTICSNVHCKINSVTIKALGPFSKIKLLDKYGYILCPICQDKNLDLARNGAGGQHHLKCCSNGHSWKHDWKDGQKFYHLGQTNYVWRNGSLASGTGKKGE